MLLGILRSAGLALNWRSGWQKKDLLKGLSEVNGLSVFPCVK